MSDWKAKRFWKEATPVEQGAGWSVTLDGRPVKTPAKTPLVVPTRVLAQAIAAEWDAQEGVIDPLSMPVTRAANAAIDKVAPMRAEVIEELAGYGGTDLLCYRATEPEALMALQSEAWDPWLAWSAAALDAPLVTIGGVMHAPQPPESLARLRTCVAAHDDFELAGLHDLVALSGSLVLALAVARGKLDPSEAWRLSRVDEDWQISQWGADDDATAMAEAKSASFLNAAQVLRLCRDAG